MGEFLARTDVVTFGKTPFSDGETVRLGEFRKFPWKVVNKGGLIRFTNYNELEVPKIYSEVEFFVDRAPVTKNIFGFGRKGPERTFFVPTLSTAAAFQRRLFKDIETAGLTPYQTQDMSRSHHENFLSFLCEDGLQPYGFNPDLYLHDLLTHWLGSAAQEPRSFEVFQKLFAARDAIQDEFGEDARVLYTEGLADAYDASTPLIIIDITAGLPVKEWDLLLGHSVAGIEEKCGNTHPGVLERSIELIEECDFGTPKRDSVTRTYIVPEEMEIATPHYEKVAKILGQPALELAA